MASPRLEALRLRFVMERSMGRGWQRILSALPFVSLWMFREKRELDCLGLHLSPPRLAVRLETAATSESRLTQPFWLLVLDMASITLKNIPDGIHTHYKWLAKRNSRSLQAEIFLALEERAELGGLEKNLKADEVFGCLTSGKKGVTIEDMNRGIDEMFRKEWKR